ncbi:uncharacterized protein J3D65DRAFT_607655 [Phyllosticta citribraziliensis]|uniref:Uncharacterized protein n=1 Tax=Phyllosticta citribraziliensis TaxID=989973 RepID=A0ABR1L5P5_9PEZI
MASATDVITYVGVPLTVMGIMPILWNFLKAFLIRFRLSQTIPWELRPFYTISADAANGDVTVVIDSISCVHPGLWPDEKTGVQYTLSPGMMFKRWSHRAFYRLMYKCEPIYTKFTRSAYVKRSQHVGKSLRRIGERLKECQNDFVSESKAREAAVDVFAELEKDYKQPLQPGSYCMRLGSPSLEEILFGHIFSHQKFRQLQELLKGYKNAQAEVGAWDDDLTFLAHVIMGCKMWDMLQCEPWEADENIVSDMQQIRQKLEDPSLDVDKVCQLLEEAAGRAECGIYTAPKEPICDLFEKFRSKGTVYLI